MYIMKILLTKVCLLLLVALLTTYCARHKTLSPKDQCSKNITDAGKAIKQKAATFDKKELRRIRNLVKAAKIQQQHDDISGCLDKTNRALTLLKEDEISKKAKKDKSSKNK